MLRRNTVLRRVKEGKGCVRSINRRMLMLTKYDAALVFIIY